VDASTTYNTLIAAIVTAGGPPYQFRQINPVDDQDGGEPGGNIRVGFLFRTDRGLTFTDRPGATSTTANFVVNGASGPELAYSPGRIDPTNAAFNTSRKPLAAEFEFNSHRLFVIANHWNSKGGDEPLFGRYQPPTRSSEVQRNQQAQIVNTFVDSLLALDADARVVVVGDLNDFEFSSALTTVKGGVLHALVESLPANERYTYVFEGNSQTLDHILLSNALFNNFPFAFDIVHFNAEFVNNASDHDPPIVRLTLSSPTPTPTQTQTPTQTMTPSSTPTSTGTPTQTATPTSTATPTQTATLDACAGKPLPVTIFEPDQNQTFDVTRVTVNWSISPCATRYKVVVRQDATDGPRVDRKKTTATTYRTKPLDPGHSYYIRVKACNQAGCRPSAWRKIIISPDARPEDSGFWQGGDWKWTVATVLQPFLPKLIYFALSYECYAVC
jgi:hypothetical protein